jgi:hypothetical protein
MKLNVLALVAFALLAGIGVTRADPQSQAPQQIKQQTGEIGRYDAGKPELPLWHTGA